MLPEQRKRRIVALVTEHDGRSVAELASDLDVSKATIRRDLQQLEDQSLLERSHGGAVPTTTVGREQPYGQREVQQLDAKVAIAERAVREIEEGAVVFLDSGTTTLEVAKRAPESIIAVTNSPVIALELEGSERKIKLTGGTLRHRSRSLVGPSAESFMERMNFDLLFLGANAIDSEGLMTPDEDEARIKSLMVEKSTRVVGVADLTKFGERSFMRFADLEAIDQLIVDGELPSSIHKACADAGVAVTGAPT
ncbi:MAG: DeoR/GlpR transcriptional regulator [Euryarchaeota archaeon]|nr:DeoR/GlpR transcriptional regulator [Euryarchaeota archaeon]